MAVRVGTTGSQQIHALLNEKADKSDDIIDSWFPIFLRYQFHIPEYCLLQSNQNGEVNVNHGKRSV